MKKVIESYLPVFKGFYGSIFECDEENSIEEGKTYDDYTFDYEDYRNRVANACVIAIGKQLTEFGIIVEFQALQSPKYYNYSNDTINVAYTLESNSFQKVIDYCKDNEDEFAEYLENHFKSYDGFMSFFDYDVETWYNEYLNLEHEKISTILGSVLDFCLTNEDYNSDWLYEQVSDETCYVSATLNEEV